MTIDVARQMRRGLLKPRPLRFTIADSIRVPEPVRCREWAQEHVVIPEETESPGKFDLALCPHVAEVLETFDEPHVREIYLEWATRLTKTTTALTLLMKATKNDPQPALFVSSDKDRANDTINNQFYPLLEACRATADLLLPAYLRNQRYVNLERCRVRVGWSGSPSRMAGFPACYIVGSEVSKWSKRLSSEADPIHLVRERAKNYPFDSKIVFESTPGLAGKCNITQLMEAPGVDVRRRFVPCPHCGLYQQLEFGDRDSEHGIKWDKDEKGRSNANLAERTAYYRCLSGCRIDDEDRPAMMRRGVWLSGQIVNGKWQPLQTVDGDGTVHGERPKWSRVGFGPLSSLYSLMIAGWGQIAKAFFDAKTDREGLRNFTNSWLAEVWSPRPIKITEDEIPDRIGSDQWKLKVVPEDCVFLTAAADVSAVGDDYLFHWMVCGWGAFERCWLIDIGQTFGQQKFQSTWTGWAYRRADGNPLPVSRIGIDSGFHAQAMYQLCRPFANFAWPLKGSSHNEDHPFVNAQFPDMFRLTMQVAGHNPKVIAILRKHGKFDLIEVNTHRSEQWVENRLLGRVKRGAPDWFSVPIEALEGEVLPGVHLPKHLLGDVLTETGTWAKRYENQHFRDALRYNVVLAYLLTHNGRDWPHLRRAVPRPPASKPRSDQPRRRSSGGGGWLPMR